jgi:hypothetical protein
MRSFVDFAEVKARCSIEQAAKLLGLQTTEERSQLRTPCRSVVEARGRSSSLPICAQGNDERLRRRSNTSPDWEADRLHLDYRGKIS